MAFNFRLHRNGVNTNTDWASCQPYGNNVISQILAPNGNSAGTEITSVPSPFARIALVKSAYNEVLNDLKGNTIYHKMVSDSLDVAQIFFNYGTLSDKFKIIVWDAQKDLEKLQQSHPEVYTSLRIFLEQDAPVYNFNNNLKIYILVYVGEHRKTQLDVVGATSPASLFFTPANDLSYIDITLGQDKLFDNNFQPLYNRDPKFVEYLFTFRNNYGPNFAIHFPEVNAYLEQTYEMLSADLKNSIDNIGQSDQNYEPLRIDDTNSVDILGAPYHKKPIEKVVQSDFLIANSHYQGKLPLVLPVESGNTYKDHFYVQDKWGDQHAAPYSDSTDWQNRRLPFDGTPHPYLTISDFLEDTIIINPYKAYTENFFFGGWDDSDIRSLLLPIKPLFFEFFSVEQLMRGVNGRSMLKISKAKTGDGVNVELTIPIARGEILYSRFYTKNNLPDGRSGNVTVINRDFGLAMLPMVQIDGINDYYYRIALAHDYNDHKSYEVECFYKGEKVDGVEEVIRNQKDSSYLKTHVFTKDSKLMDTIRVKIGSTYGMVVPQFSSNQRNRSFTFAVDFGTTNTHIAYKEGQSASSCLSSSTQLKLWSESRDMVKNVFEVDLLPISDKDANAKNREFVFPIRTALFESSNIQWNSPVVPLAHTNIAFTYGSKKEFDYNDTVTNLKWSNDANNPTRIRSYIENLMLLMRNMVLQEGGQLENTKIVWFYPEAMSTNRRNLYTQIWDQAFKKYFGNNRNNIQSVLESVAPYQYFLSTNQAASRMVTIDIGGGTTDVVIAENQTIKYTTSFHFAANTIFGDGYATNSNTLNGIIAHFKDHFIKAFSDNGLNDLKEIFERIERKGKSTELASFLFSLKNNYTIREKGIQSCDWNELLQLSDNFKELFLLFYSAIIYHIAHIMRIKGLEPPRHIAFSGNGSRVISVLSPDMGTLADYTKNIFCRIFEKDYPNGGLDIILPDNPKEVTCKGGLEILRNNVNLNNSGEKLILCNIKQKTFFNTNNDTYQLLSDKIKREVTDEVKTFLNFILSDSKLSRDIDEKFGIKLDEDILNESLRDLDTFLNKGLEDKQPNDLIEETLFFYSLVGVLHHLCDYIYKKNSNQNINN